MSEDSKKTTNNSNDDEDKDDGTNDGLSDGDLSYLTDSFTFSLTDEENFMEQLVFDSGESDDALSRDGGDSERNSHRTPKVGGSRRGKKKGARSPYTQRSKQKKPRKKMRATTYSMQQFMDNSWQGDKSAAAAATAARISDNVRENAMHEHFAMQKKMKSEKKAKNDSAKTSRLPIICMLVLIIVLLGVALVLALYFGFVAKQDAAAEEDTKLMHILPKDTMDTIHKDKDSPQARAYAWMEGDIAVNSPQHLNHRKIQQRFTLATFYFATNGEHWTTTTHNNGEGVSSLWLHHDVHECGWDIEHISCFHMLNDAICDWQDHSDATCRLVKLNFPSIGLDGTLPPEISILSDLVHFDVSDNNLSGSLPLTIGDLTSLRILNLNQNAFTGTIITEIGKLSHLVDLDLSKNYFRGAMPEQIGQLSDNLVELQIQENDFHDIPTTIGDLHQLELLNLSNNKLGPGPIPTFIGRLSNLHSFIAGKCRFTGTIPTEILEISTALVSLRLPHNHLNGTSNFKGHDGNDNIYEHLEFLDLSHNHFNGPLPANNHHLFPKIKYMVLDTNHFTGTIHPDVGYLTTLEALSFSKNRLSGTIPTALSQLTKLRDLVLDNADDDAVGEEYYVNENRFKGSIPNELCKLTEKEVGGLEITVDCGTVPCNCSCICTQGSGEVHDEE